MSSGCLESSLSLALKTPLPEDDEPHSEDVSLTHSLALNASLQVRTGFYSEHTPATPKIENEPSLGVSDDKPLVEAPLDSANARSKDITIPAKAIFPIRKPIRQLRQPRCRLSKEPEIAFVNASVSRKVVFGGMGPSWLGDRLEGADEVIGGLEGGAIVSFCLKLLPRMPLTNCARSRRSNLTRLLPPLLMKIQLAIYPLLSKLSFLMMMNFVLRMPHPRPLLPSTLSPSTPNPVPNFRCRSWNANPLLKRGPMANLFLKPPEVSRSQDFQMVLFWQRICILLGGPSSSSASTVPCWLRNQRFCLRIPWFPRRLDPKQRG